MDAFSGQAFRPLAVSFWQQVLPDPGLDVISLESSLLERAFVLFSNRLDKNWSFTDCISFVVMQGRGIKLALTGDRHFEQAGFERAFRTG